MSNNEKSASQVAEELVSVTNGLRLGAGETILSVRGSEPEKKAASTPKKTPITETTDDKGHSADSDPNKPQITKTTDHKGHSAHTTDHRAS
ncbi:hypothetical protein [Microcoleus sp. B7-D4]|uniref:hypothetical protein n=1 Tax=Microcoleus sp. B7-D4 TaxID=2818696 RepID=UPI002FD55E47